MANTSRHVVLIVPTKNVDESSQFIVEAQSPATLIVWLPESNSANNAVYLDVCAPGPSWYQTDKFKLGANSDRRIHLNTPGTYRARKDKTNKPVGVFIYR